MFVGAIVGGIVGGLFGGLGALISGTSVKAGVVSGALTGAAVGYIGDNVFTGGVSSLVGASILCAGVSAIGNITNQYMNYKIETENAKDNSKVINGLTNNTSIKNVSNQKENKGGFGDYIDYGSIAMSALTAGAFTPISLGAGNLINSAFQGAKGRTVEVVANGIANAMFEVNNSSMQMIMERIMEVCFE